MYSSQCPLCTHIVRIYIVLWTCLIRLLILVKHLYLSGMWLGVTPKMNTKKTYLRESGLYAQK